jgi:hypothetical protein
MGYKMSCFDINKDVVAVGMGRKTPEDVLNDFRKRVINGMLHGAELGINMDRTRPNFTTDYKEGPTNWNSFSVFDFATFRNKDEYRKILMDEDLKDIMGSECQR